jgi:hypothetical protein
MKIPSQKHLVLSLKRILSLLFAAEYARIHAKIHAIVSIKMAR